MLPRAAQVQGGNAQGGHASPKRRNPHMDETIRTRQWLCDMAGLRECSTEGQGGLAYVEPDALGAGAWHSRAHRPKDAAAKAEATARDAADKARGPRPPVRRIGSPCPCSSGRSARATVPWSAAGPAITSSERSARLFASQPLCEGRSATCSQDLGWPPRRKTRRSVELSSPTPRL